MKNLSLLVLLLIPAAATALVSEKAALTRSRLLGAFSSPSGKLTLAPELVIPEPTESTALLLQANAIQTLSGRIRACKANVALVRGSITALKTFTIEQENALGNFPGPVPVVYACPIVVATDDNDGENTVIKVDMEAVAEAGADGILVSACQGAEIQTLEELATNTEWIETCQQAWDCGLQPIPEVTVNQAVATKWTEDDVTALVESVCSALKTDPVSILVTVNPVNAEQQEPVTLPTVPKSAGKRVPVLGSVRVTAGDNRVNIEQSRFKENGFTGTLLRSECLPGTRVQLDLEIVGKFWSACINDLKSTRSKTFSFRAKNKMHKNVATEWVNYQSDIMESGALGDPNESFSMNDSEGLSVMDEGNESGDYKGFA
jgi:hypothetical protein